MGFLWFYIISIAYCYFIVRKAYKVDEDLFTEFPLLLCLVIMVIPVVNVIIMTILAIVLIQDSCPNFSKSVAKWIFSVDHNKREEK